MKIKQLNNLLKIGRLKIENLTDKFTLLNLLTLLGLLSTLTAAIWFIGRQPKQVEAGWFNDNWMYRKSIPVTNNTTEETDVYISVTIDTSDTAKFQGDCGDLRFTKQNGQQLDYYISSSCGTASTVIHVNFDTFPTSNQTLYYYYGNPSIANGFASSDFSTEASNYSIGSIGSEEQSPGPIAYWKFDEGYGDTAYDSSQNSNDGTIYNATWKPESECLSGKCLYLDGDGDYVQIPDSDSLDVDRNGTWEAWVKSDLNMSNRGSLIFKHYNNEYEILVADTGIIQVYHGDGTWEEINEPSAKTVSANEWTHIAVVRDHDTQTYTWYINGVNSGTDTYTTTPLASGNDVYIGTRAGGTNYKGYVDEIKIYPYARSAEEIKADYASRGSSQGISAQLSSESNSSGTLSEGLVGYWKMDETSWNGTTDEVIDSSGNGNHGTGVGATAPPTTGAGKFGNAGNFDGSDDYINVSNPSGVNETLSNITMAAWVKVDSGESGDQKWFISRGEGWDTDNVILYMDNGEARFTIHGYDQIASSSIDIRDDTWHHLVGIYNSSLKSNTLQIYIDGKLEDTGEYTGNIPSSTDATQIGQRGATSGKYINMNIDEVRVYNRALSPKEVRDLYNWAPGPIAYYNFDEGSGTNLYDKSGNGNSSDSFGGDPTWTKGKYGNSLDFDDNDYARNNTFSIGSDPNFTVTGWFKKTANMNSSGAWGMGAGGTSRETISGWCNNGENIGIDLWGTSTYYVNEEYPLNDWVHIAWVKTAATFTPSTLKIYVNGVERDLNVNRDGADTVSLSSGLTVGGIYASSSYNAPVTVDDFKIYNYARSQKQIVEDMNASHPIGGSPVGSQASYWSFNEGYGDTTHDISGQGNDGQLGTGSSAPSWTNTGKFGKALSFNGSTTRVTVSDSGENPLDITDEITISTWLYPTSGTGKYPLYKLGAFEISWADNAYGGTKIGGSIWDANGNRRRVNSSDNYSYDQWYHVAVTAKKYDKHNLYINGSLIDSNDFDYSGIQETDNDLVIGDYQGGGFAFEGVIDEVKVYSSALTEDEIKLDYNQGKSAVMGSTGTDSSGNASNSSERSYCPPGDTTSDCAPVLEWKFDEKTGSNANDTSGNGNTGTLYNMEANDWFSSAQCIHGGCINIDDTTDESIEAPHSSELTPASVTVEGWFKLRDRSDRHITIVKWYGYSLEINSGGYPYFRLRDISPVDLVSDEAISWNEWHHIAASFNDGTKERKVYIDGKLTGSDTPTGSITYNTNNIRLGYTGNYMDGYTDDVRVYDYARTPAQIAWDFNRGKPVGWWKLDECEGTTAYDSSGNGNNGTITIGGSGNQDTVGSCGVGNTAAAWSNGSNGKINSSLNFDGSDDKVTITDPTQGELDFGTDGDFSVFTWIKGTDSSGGVVTKREPSTLEGYRIYIFNGKPYSVVDSTGSNCVESTSVDTVNDGNWHQIGLVADRDSNVKFYTDGKLVHTCDTATNDGTVTNDEDLKFGTDRYDSQFWNGQIDDVRIYNYALTPLQVKDLYNQGGAIRFTE